MTIITYGTLTKHITH